MNNRPIKVVKQHDLEEDWPKASIIISNYEGLEFLPQCLNNLVNQTYENYEIIFVDAGSHDGSAEYVEREFPSVKTIKCSHIGIGEAINIGIRHSAGDIIVFDVNTDEFVDCNWLEEIIKQLKRYNYKIITGTTRIIYGTSFIDEAGVKLNWLGRAKKVGHLKNINNYLIDDKPVGFVGTPAFHRMVLDKIGYVDETYFLYAEDLDFCYRAKLVGYETRCAPQAKSHHCIRGTIGKKAERLEYFLRRANLRFHFIYMSFPKLLINFIYNCIFLPALSFTVTIMQLKMSAIHYKKLNGRINAAFWNLKNMKNSLILRKMYKFEIGHKPPASRRLENVNRVE